MLWPALPAGTPAFKLFCGCFQMPKDRNPFHRWSTQCGAAEPCRGYRIAEPHCSSGQAALLPIPARRRTSIVHRRLRLVQPKHEGKGFAAPAAHDMTGPRQPAPSATAACPSLKQPQSVRSCSGGQRSRKRQPPKQAPGRAPMPTIMMSFLTLSLRWIAARQLLLTP